MPWEISRARSIDPWRHWDTGDMICEWAKGDEITIQEVKSAMGVATSGVDLANHHEKSSPTFQTQASWASSIGFIASIDCVVRVS